MALTDQERAFMSDALAAGVPEETVVAKIKERRAMRPAELRGTDPRGPRRGDEMFQPDNVAPSDLITKNVRPALDLTGKTRRLQEEIRAGEPGENVSQAEARTKARMDATADPLNGGHIDSTTGAVLGQAMSAMPLASAAANPLVRAAQNIGYGGVRGFAGNAAAGGDPKDPLPVIIGAGGAAIGEGLSAAAKAVRASKGAAARELLSKYGGDVNGAGIPEIADLPANRRGVGAASRRAAKNIRETLGTQFDENYAQPSQAARQAVESETEVPETLRTAGLPPPEGSRVDVTRTARPAAENLRDATTLRAKIADLRYSDRTPLGVRPYLDKELEDLDKLRIGDGRVVMTEKQLNDFRGRYSDMAKYGAASGSGTIRDRTFKEMARAAKDLVDEGPYSETNKIYAEGMEGVRADRRLMNLKTKPNADASVDDRKIAQWLRNRSNDSEAAGAMAEPSSHELFAERHPDLQRQMDLPDMVRARATLTPGLGGSTDNLIQAAGHGKLGLLGRAAHLAQHNANAIAGRYLYDQTGPMGSAGQAMQLQAPNVAAALAVAKRQHDAVIIDGIFGKKKQQPDNQGAPDAVRQ